MSKQLNLLAVYAIKAHPHEHEITIETSNDKAAERQMRRQYIHTATSAGLNVV